MYRSVHRVLVGVLACWVMQSSAWAQAPLWAGDFANPQQSHEGVEAAIDTAVAKMSFIKRPIARSRLNKTNASYQRIRITQDGAVIRVQFDERKPIEMPADGKAVPWTREDGEVFQVSAQSSDKALVQTFKAEDGERVNTFTANEAGQMTMETEISSSQLPSPVIYTLLYQRTSASP